MAEFYVTYDWNGLHYIAIVAAPQQPPFSQFSNYEELHTTMDALGHEWMMTYEMPDPSQFAFEQLAVWEKQLAQTIELISVSPIPTRWRGLLE